ncbi:uncharacterized protein MONBRDRAFT_31438 [Monosiga brevicollis MX1]|uniref:Uncharacterized protein n=1 Tax=Monosiga brevicollis TaxID=81824 RepID=A9UT54_MONBE|nr:uncharacterized protein MONBRDRAFT_31438 [Monosiga brevicollis MX1]EDQ91187.1 predicted protein [Monosiga brevicollis MX1]|eukprot:XP_001743609.1 hypothetical protein [Monosiga brevicollis MX1]
MRLAVRQAGSRTFYRAALGDDGHLHPIVDEKGHVYPIRNARVAEHKPVLGRRGGGPQAIAALVDDDVQAAVAGPNDEILAAQLSAAGVLEAVMSEDGDLVELRNSDGTPATGLDLSANNAVVVGNDGSPAIAVVDEKGLPLEACFERGQLVARRDENGETLPIVGPDGLAAVPAVSRHGCPRLLLRCAVVLDASGKARAACIAQDGLATRAVVVDAAKGLVGPEKSGKTTVWIGGDSDADARIVYADSSVISARNTGNKGADTAGAAANGEGSTDAADPASAAAPANMPPASVSENPALVAELQAKLAQLQKAMVAGGGAAKDKALRKKLKDRHARAEERRRKLQEAKSADDDTMMEAIYDTMQDEIHAKSKLLKRAKEVVREQKAEIEDLQAEFQRERQHLLDQLRANERELLFYKSYTQRASDCIRRDTNYANVEKIRKVAVWNEEQQRWVMPKVVVSRVSLPTAGERVGSAVSRTQSGRSFREFSDADDDDDQGFRDKLAQRNAANTDYFQGKRSTDVVHKIAQREAELANQLEDKLKRFDRGPLQSTRSQQLLQEDATASLDRRKGRGRSALEPGAVSLVDMANNRQKLRPPRYGQQRNGPAGW